jgi:hypothetical protein
MKIIQLFFFPLWMFTTGFAVEELPRVLLIGDSISIGYTPHVTSTLKGKAKVIHHRGNAQHTSTGLKMIDRWLGKTSWDVIHFNWGLWDLCYRSPQSNNPGRRDKVNGKLTTSLAAYEANLNNLVRRLKKTKAHLIWAHTTTVPQGEVGRKVGDDDRYNLIAERVMKAHGIRINDLNALTDQFSSEIFVKPGDVHYGVEGYKRIGAVVAGEITKSLQTK